MFFLTSGQCGRGKGGGYGSRPAGGGGAPRIIYILFFTIKNINNLLLTHNLIINFKNKLIFYFILAI
jgi:hypothetical protein